MQEFKYYLDHNDNNHNDNHNDNTSVVPSNAMSNNVNLFSLNVQLNGEKPENLVSKLTKPLGVFKRPINWTANGLKSLLGGAVKLGTSVVTSL